MYIILAFLLLAGESFWESKPPRQWTQEELEEIFRESPWARILGQRSLIGNLPAVQVYLASAKPMREAEEELERRLFKGNPTQEAPEDDYREFLRENPGRYIILAVRLPDPDALADAAESRRMEQECWLRTGRKKLKMTGHFPPTPPDPYLRLVFPRELDPGDKKLLFELYLPSVPAPYRSVEFYLKEMVYKGKLEI